jgi:hypothetical protein
MFAADGVPCPGASFLVQRINTLPVRAADKTSHILDIKYCIRPLAVTDVGTPCDDMQWAAVPGMSPAERLPHSIMGA